MFADLQLGRPLPFRDEIGEFESGNGYALRMSEMNDLRFHDLISRVASVGHCYVPVGAARWIAHVYGASSIRLQTRLPARSRHGGETAVDLFGHHFSKPYFVRTTRPQVCSACLGEGLPCLVTWELSLITECPRHQCQLVDQCAACRRRLSWRRDGLYFCTCGADLRDTPTATSEVLPLGISALCESLMFRTSDQYDVPGWLRPLGELSLDTFLRFAYAVAQLRADQAMPRSRSRTLLSSETRALAMDVGDVLKRAHEGESIFLPKPRTAEFRSLLEHCSLREQHQILQYLRTFSAPGAGASTAWSRQQLTLELKSDGKQ